MSKWQRRDKNVFSLNIFTVKFLWRNINIARERNVQSCNQQMLHGDLISLFLPPLCFAFSHFCHYSHPSSLSLPYPHFLILGNAFLSLHKLFLGFRQIMYQKLAKDTIPKYVCIKMIKVEKLFQGKISITQGYFIIKSLIFYDWQVK